MKAILRFIRISISSLFFLGYIPFASGTIGSLVSIGLLWYFRDFLNPFLVNSSGHSIWLLLIVFCMIAVFFCSDCQNLFRSDDPKQVILDEFVGQLFTFYMLPLRWEILVMGFCLFRFYDIVKPYPIHHFEKLDDGLGIVMDDVVAGILANLTLFVMLAGYHAIRSHL